jgi:hypothetical protein
MAEGKKIFQLYTELIDVVGKMPDDKAGMLFKHVLAYVNDLDPSSDDLLVQLTFEPIKQRLKRDLVRWESMVLRNRLNGNKGGRPKNPENPVGSLGNPTEPKEPDKDKDKDINKKLNKKVAGAPPPPTLNEFMIYLKDNYLKNNQDRYKQVRQHMIDTYQLWKENNWKDGNDKPIKNWKVKAISQLRYIKK